MGTNDLPNNRRHSSAPDSDSTLSTGLGGGAAGHIGPYRLLQRLGEGGMGEVWLAEQKTPIHRTVAVKLIKAGMDTKAVVARFETEQQALALMDHPSIARVFDAGSTAEGHPYFVMEFMPDCLSPHIATSTGSRSKSGWNCLCRSATACSTRIRKRSFTGI